MTRKDLLAAAEAIICEDREEAYGKPEDNFKLIASFWRLYLEAKGSTNLDAKDIAVMMALLKIARIATGEHKDDNYIDLIGYAACGGEVAEKRMSQHGDVCVRENPSCLCLRCVKDTNESGPCCSVHSRVCGCIDPCSDFEEEER